jgi:CRP/FNR family transcriptional regulator
MKKKGDVVIGCDNCNTRLNSIFCTLDTKEALSLDKGKATTFYKKGQLIFNKNTTAHGLFIIYSGKVKVYQSADNGREQIVSMLTTGDVIGYRALLSNDRYSTSAEVLVDSQICFIPKELFFNMLKTNTTLAITLLKLITSDLKKAELNVTSQAQRTVRERMAKALLELKETFGYELDNKTIDVALTREELSNLIGTATETTIRLLSTMKSENIIDFVGKKIKIVNIQKLTIDANAND